MRKSISILLLIFSMLTSKSVYSIEKLTFEMKRGDPKELSSLIQKLRIKTYYPFPYLYSFTQDPNEEDISYYQNDQTLVSIAKSNGQIIALATGIPLVNYHYDEFFAKDHFAAHLKSGTKNIFLIDEILFEEELNLQDRYQIGKQLLLQMEAALLHSPFKHIAKLIVERPVEHPLRPSDYFDEEKIIKNINYVSTDILISVPWTTRIAENEKRYQNNPMRFWVKPINT